MSVAIRIRNGMEVDEYGDGGATEGDVRGSHSDIIEQDGGVVDVEGGYLLVHEAASPGMSVVVDEGIGYIPNDSYEEFNSDSIKFWEAVVGGTTGERTLVIGANSSGQTRIDLACLKIDPSTPPDLNAENIAELIIVQGTPGAGAPAIPAFHLKLAEITVVNGASEIENVSINDTRVQITFKSALLDLPPTNRAFAWFISGTLATGSNQGPRYIVPQDMTIQKVWLRARTAPTGASILIDINKNGSTIWSSQGNRGSISAGQLSGNTEIFNTIELSAGDYLDLDIDQIGSTIAGEDLTVVLECLQ